MLLPRYLMLSILEFPLRTVEDVPFINVYEKEIDEVPFDISDIIAKRKAGK